MLTKQIRARRRGQDASPPRMIRRRQSVGHLVLADVPLMTRHQLAGIADHMLNGVACCRMEYRHGKPDDFVYLYTNRAFHDQTGLGPVVGNRVTEVIPDIRRSDPDLFDRYARVAAGGPAEKFELYVRALDDWFSVEVFCPRVGYFTAIFDVITLHKSALLALQDQRDHLESMVAERTTALTEATENAEAAAAAKGDFLANMSHEIRTPLNAIIGLTHLALQTPLSTQQQGYLSAIDQAGTHLLQVVNSVLDLSKLEAGSCVLEQSPFDLASLLAEVAGMLQESAHGKGLALLTQVQGGPTHLIGDVTRLKQGLLNYASNAIKFTEAGYVSLRARVELAGQHEVTVRFDVEDTGCGIAMDVIPRLFSDFEQGSASIARQHGGTGLGLAITRRLAELMGGTVGVRSEPGEGSTFWFTAQLLEDPQDWPASAPRSADGAEIDEQAGRGGRILLVEDEPLNRMVAEAILEPLGARIDVAHDGIEAIERCASCDYDLVLMDMQMPRMGGVEASRRLRRMPRTAQVPIVALTANAPADVKGECLAAGIDDVLPKPVEPDVLVKVARAHLSKGGQVRSAPLRDPPDPWTSTESETRQ